MSLQERITSELQTAFGGSGIKSFLLENVLGSLQVDILLLTIHPASGAFATVCSAEMLHFEFDVR